MINNFLIGFCLFIAYCVIAGLPPILLRLYFNTPFEVTRKMFHLVITLSIFPLLKFFGTWYMAVLAVLIFLVIVYPILLLVERSHLYKRIAVERKNGKFKSSLIVVLVSIAVLLTVFWGLLGTDWQYVAVVALLAWGFGDAAAALVGKAFGRRRIQHPQIEGAKTYEGTLAMYLVAGLTIFLTLFVYAGQSWQISLAVAALVAPVSATVELFSRKGMDTLTVPLSAALATLILLVLISFIGV
jgi:dolichol kinase